MRYSAFCALLIMLPWVSRAQSPTTSPAPLDTMTRTDVAEKFAQALADEYTYADKGANMAEAIRNKLKSGSYDKLSSPAEFAHALQTDAQAVIHDLHLMVGFNAGPGRVMMMRRGGPPSPEMLAQMRKQNAAITEVKILDGNIGYMPVNGMLPAQAANDAIAAAFAFLHNTDALIIDLRSNPGGSGYAEVYLSYLSEGPPYVTGHAHWRKDNRDQEFKTTDMGKASYGAKKPVFVLISKQTFSAAEGLAYEIQAFKRGTLVGEKTGGGANPSAGGGMVQLGHGFTANIPTGYVVNAVTGTNWEGVGVKPDVEVPADQALAKAWSLAASRLLTVQTDSQKRISLEALSLATLDGEPTLNHEQIAGFYGPTGARPIGGGMTITENQGKLYLHRVIYTNRGRQELESLLVPSGGDRFVPEGTPYGSSSLTFFPKDGKVELLHNDRMGSAVLVKQ